ncbi:MAG: hypothetical protein NZ651_04330 [Candidatus Bipolaricaulota bacterium]|nr:hypothetical protein [Candidatus Bipolaricaulota bacterium]MDW8126978.1 hypothetical protein [Candidatus Bipolaricaulota bacterium]
MRALTLGWDLEGGELTRAELPTADSLASFDVVLIDPLPLPALWQPYAELSPDGTQRLYPGRDLGFSRALENLFGLRQRELEDLLLRAGGILVVRVRAAAEGVIIDGTPPRRLDNYGFLPKASLVSGPHHLAIPNGLRFLPRRGQDVYIADPLHPLAPYIQRFSSSGYEAVLIAALGAPLSAFGRVLAQNRVGDILGLDLPVGLGRILFLPAFPGADGREAWALLRSGLAELLSLPLPEVAPDWLSDYPLPGEEELQKRLNELAEERARLAKKEEELQAVRRDYLRLKALIYPRGKAALVEAAKEAFVRLGFTVREGRTSMSFFAESEEGSFYVHVAFSPFSPVGPEEHRALLLALDKLRNEEREDVKGLLLCLSQPELDPRRRGPPWEEAVERASRDHHLVLVSAADLFRAVVEVLSGKDPKSVRKMLGETEGPWRPRFGSLG